MIKYALICHDCETGFEGWFASSSAYDAQIEAGLLECHSCASRNIKKQIMAPAVRTSGQKSSNTLPDAAKLFKAAREHIASTHDYTGSDFPHEARAMHYGEIKERPIWGESSPEEAKALQEEGINAQPLPAPMAPTPPKSKSELN